MILLTNAKRMATDKEELMVPCIRFFLGGDATVVTLTAAVISVRTNVARTLALHWVVGTICVQRNTDFCTPSGGSIADLNWLFLRQPGWR